MFKSSRNEGNHPGSAIWRSSLQTAEGNSRGQRSQRFEGAPRDSCVDAATKSEGDPAQLQAPWNVGVREERACLGDAVLRGSQACEHRMLKGAFREEDYREFCPSFRLKIFGRLEKEDWINKDQTRAVSSSCW